MPENGVCVRADLASVGVWWRSVAGDGSYQ